MLKNVKFVVLHWADNKKNWDFQESYVLAMTTWCAYLKVNFDKIFYHHDFQLWPLLIGY